MTYRTSTEAGSLEIIYLSYMGLQMRKVSPKEGKELGAVLGPDLRTSDSQMPFSTFIGFLLCAKHYPGHWEFRSKQVRCLFSHGISTLG